MRDAQGVLSSGDREMRILAFALLLGACAAPEYPEPRIYTGADLEVMHYIGGPTKISCKEILAETLECIVR